MLKDDVSYGSDDMQALKEWDYKELKEWEGVDFKQIKEKIHKYLDHGNLNELLPFNPTAENIARWVVEQIPQCYKAVVQESDGNFAIYEED